MAQYGVFNDEGCTDVFDTLPEAQAQADEYKAEDDGYYADLIEVHEMCPDHTDEGQPKDTCEECFDGSEDESEAEDEDDEDEKPSSPPEPVDFAVINTALGDIRVHAADCADITRDRKRYGTAPVIIRSTDQRAIVADFMSDFIEEGSEPEELDGDFVWLPCCGDLPWESAKPAAPAAQDPEPESETTPPAAPEFSYDPGHGWRVDGTLHQERAAAAVALRSHPGYDGPDPADELLYLQVEAMNQALPDSMELYGDPALGWGFLCGLGACTLAQEHLAPVKDAGDANDAARAHLAARHTDAQGNPTLCGHPSTSGLFCRKPARHDKACDARPPVEDDEAAQIDALVEWYGFPRDAGTRAALAWMLRDNPELGRSQQGGAE